MKKKTIWGMIMLMGVLSACSKTDKAIDYYESIGELNRKITDIEVDKLTLPEEGMEPEKHEKYLEIQV